MLLPLRFGEFVRKRIGSAGPEGAVNEGVTLDGYLKRVSGRGRRGRLRQGPQRGAGQRGYVVGKRAHTLPTGETRV